MKLEAPPGFEPGIEVLQTSALPLGDGADQECAVRILWLGLPTVAHRPVRSTLATRRVATVDNLRVAPERKLERETGFEPATSTLARSHSTTELFPLCGEN